MKKSPDTFIFLPLLLLAVNSSVYTQVQDGLIALFRAYNKMVEEMELVDP